MQTVSVHAQKTLDDYEAMAYLASTVRDLRAEAQLVVPSLEGRTVWMVNSTAQGGGVAEMLPKMVSLLRELGVKTEWAVIETDRAAFFDLTKRIHNMIHGVDGPELSADDRRQYESVNRENADALASRLGPRDVLVVHDPQPLPLGRMLKEELGVPFVWRCHIGLDERLPATKGVWSFLRSYATSCDRAIFSAPEYIPGYLSGRSAVIFPAIDPLSHKNRVLSVHKLVGVLNNSALTSDSVPVLMPPYEHVAQRLGPDGTWVRADALDDIGLLYRPIVTQVSRWDRLKGFAELLEAFVKLKRRPRDDGLDPLHQRRRELVRLVLAGPDPTSVADDPEGREVVADLCRRYVQLPRDIQEDVALVSLPMASRRENALMVNALQRCSSIVAQNSLREGFGLTLTEAMWKRTAVVGSSACGLRQQVRDGLDGRLVPDATDTDTLAAVLDELLADPAGRDLMARNAERRVLDEFLIFTQLGRYLRLIDDVVRSYE